jgi:magnesium transporter
MEDVLNLHQRPKVEEFDDHLFLIACMAQAESTTNSNQVAMFLGNGYLLSFQEEAGDSFDLLRNRIRQGKGRVRSQAADYLCYALLDSVVDGYFPVLEEYGELLEVLEDSVITKPESQHIKVLHDMKRQLLGIRRSVWPHREMLNAFIRDENPLVAQDTRIYLRDVYDHTVQLMDIIETYREIASGLVDVYISSVSVKLNEIMKVLTVFATIFMPLGFIASLYGMNFDRSVSPWNMPELGWRFGYLFSLILMGGIAVGLLIYFRSQGWMGRKRK